MNTSTPQRFVAAQGEMVAERIYTSSLPGYRSYLLLLIKLSMGSSLNAYGKAIRQDYNLNLISTVFYPKTYITSYRVLCPLKVTLVQMLGAQWSC